MQQEEYLAKLYSNRFDRRERQVKKKLWKVFIESFLQEYVGKNSTVLDIAGGYCEFINQIRAKEKYLIDLNPDSKKFANSDVNVLNINILDCKQTKLLNQQFDQIFVSNFFEHLQSKEELMDVLGFCYKHLNPGGSLLIIQPNFKYSYKEYYDYIDHHLPITHLSLAEVLKAVGFEIKQLIPRFLPFSTKGRPSSPMLLKIYLKIPFAWQFLGTQMFVQASKPIF
ncbi:MAG: methyltransferase domain-containing protein [Scytonema sp. PMC 1070.18]|nr:methyltransferase domain-containing protein [Scytonema sp. PMC 1070.18]